MKMILSADDFGRSHEMNLAIDYAIKNNMVLSAALLMGSEYTEEAVRMAVAGGYIRDVHCHLNLAACRKAGNHFVPLNEAYKKSRFCRDGEFASAKYYRPDFMKYADIIYQELETQFLTFKAITDNQANYKHIDFHLYMNLSLPVAVAYDRLIKRYRIQSARFFGEHQGEVKESRKHHLIHAALMFRWRHSKGYRARSSGIDYYLARRDSFRNAQAIELYVHLGYMGGVLIDKTNSVFGNEMKPMEEQLALVKKSGEYEYVSWRSMNP